MPTVNFDENACEALLAGDTFDPNIHIVFKFPPIVRDRLEEIRDLVKGKSVLHIGCCDHIGEIKPKMATGTWLHGMLTDLCSDCIGVDIDSEAVEYAKTVSGLANIYTHDITSENKLPEISGNTFDYILLGEVLEHIGNPVEFLQKIQMNYGDNCKEIIITVPNATRFGNVRNIFRSAETINSDHRFFFTPYTLAKIARDAGIRLKSVRMARYAPAGTLKRSLLNRFPLGAENIVFVGQPIRSPN